jgi:hypothetical protein
MDYFLRCEMKFLPTGTIDQGFSADFSQCGTTSPPDEKHRKWDASAGMGQW